MRRARQPQYERRAAARFATDADASPGGQAQALRDAQAQTAAARALAELPKQGSRAPWKVYQNYLLDLILLRHGRLEDGSLEFR